MEKLIKDFEKETGEVYSQKRISVSAFKNSIAVSDLFLFWAGNKYGVLQTENEKLKCWIQEVLGGYSQSGTIQKEWLDSGVEYIAAKN